MRAALQGAALAFPVRCCALVGRFADPRIAESVSTLLPHLASRGVQVLVSEQATLAASATAVRRVPEREFGERADLVIAIGGDGTLLYAARLVARHAGLERYFERQNDARYSVFLGRLEQSPSSRLGKRG